MESTCKTSRRLSGAPSVWRRASACCSCVWLCAILLAPAACARVGIPTPAQTTTCVASVSSMGLAGASATNTAASAPLTYGVNLALYDTTDIVTNSATVQSTLRADSVPIIRMPFRSTLPDSYEVRAMRAIQAIHARPLVIVHGPTDKNALLDDIHLISLVQSVFGATTVYVEFGNEPELAGVSATQYAAAWNTVIACLKQMAPTYKFVGPVNAFFNPAYVTTFSRLAHPHPDVISWHEYACGNADSDALCMRRLDDWTTHITQMRQAVLAATNLTISVMITEWNLDDKPDPRYQNPAFIQSWTTAALHTLTADRADGLDAAMQYCVTNNPAFSLIDTSGALTPAGQAFFASLLQAGTAQG